MQNLQLTIARALNLVFQLCMFSPTFSLKKTLFRSEFHTCQPLTYFFLALFPTTRYILYRNRSGIYGDMGRERDTKFGVWARHIVIKLSTGIILQYHYLEMWTNHII